MCERARSKIDIEKKGHRKKKEMVDIKNGSEKNMIQLGHRVSLRWTKITYIEKKTKIRNSLYT